MSTLWEEIKRRKVIRVVIAYVLVGWALIQVADATIEPLRLPEWAGTLVIWLVALGFPVAVLLAWVFDVTPAGITTTAAEAEEKTGRGPDVSIAVLPFVNISDEPGNDYFSDGLSEELLNLLARLQSLRVCSRTTSFALKGKDLDMPTISAQLGARYVLEGSVRRAGDRVRITAQLIDAVNDSHMWSETYDRELDDIFAVQDDIAGRLFSSLKLTLTEDEKVAIKPTTSNTDALDCYLRGRAFYHRGEQDYLERSREQFECAIQTDPDYALAWAGLTYVFVDIYWYRDNEKTWMELADQASRKAIELAPHLAESHGARGLALRLAERFDEAEAEFEKAIEINPRLFEPIHFYAQMLRSLSRFERSVELFVRAAEVRPEDYQALAIAANIFETLGDRQRAIEVSRETIERVTRAVELNPNDSRGLILGAGVWGRLGEKKKALEWTERAKQVSPTSSGVMYNAACVYANLNEFEIALDHLEKAVELGSRNKRYFDTDSDFDSLREHPRFIALMEKI